MLEIVNLVLREGGIASSGMQLCVLGICKAILCGTSYQYILHGNQIFIFYFDNLEPAPGRPASELEVKAVKLDVLEQARGYPN